MIKYFSCPLGVCLFPVLMVSVGCANKPRNHDDVSAYTFEYSGVVQAPNAQIRTQIYDYDNGTWGNWGAISRSGGTVATTDCDGINWFQFNKSVLVPTSAGAYRPSANSGRAQIKLRGQWGDSFGDITTFEKNAESCMEQFCSASKIATICKSSDSPVLTLNAPCGAQDQPCCTNEQKANVCNSGLECDIEWGCKPPTWLAASAYSTSPDFPSDFSLPPWSEKIQGIAHDGMTFYVTQGGGPNKLWNTLMFTSTSNGLGCNHWGDPDVYKGHVYVPLENCSSGTAQRMAAFRTSDLGLVGISDLPNPASANNAWVAVNPANGLLYTSFQFDLVSELWAYRIVISSNSFSLVRVSKLELVKPCSQGFCRAEIKRVQGGAFSPTGKLYLASDDEDHGDGRLVAVHVGPYRAEVKWQTDVNVDYGVGQELEGIDILPNMPFNGNRSDIHMVLLNNQQPTFQGIDTYYFKHVKITDRTKLWQL